MYQLSMSYVFRTMLEYNHEIMQMYGPHLQRQVKSNHGLGTGKECWLVQNYKEKGSIVHQFTCFCMENHL